MLAVADELRSIAEMETPERELAQQLSGGEAALLPALESYLKCGITLIDDVHVTFNLR